MYTPETSRHFVKQQDESGAIYYVLSTRVAALQTGFYFVPPSMDDSGRYLWFYCYFPPANYRTLGVIDFTTDQVHHFPETLYLDASPTVDPLTGDVYYADGQAIYRRSPKPALPVEKICDLPKEFFEKKAGLIVPVTHLTFSPDRKQVFLDARTTKGCIAGALTLESGDFQVWTRPEYCRNHGQFNPVYPDLALMAEEFETDENGAYRSIRTDENGVFMRLWTVKSNGEEKVWAPLNLERATHEWWSADGRKIYYCKYDSNGNNGICAIDYFTGDHRLAAPVRAWHGFSSVDDSLFLFDENDGFYRGCASRVGLYNTKTGKTIYFNSYNPPLNPPESPTQYHLDPHPRFNANEKYIVFTTVIDGKPELAVAKTADILPMTE